MSKVIMYIADDDRCCDNCIKGVIYSNGLGWCDKHDRGILGDQVCEDYDKKDDTM